MVTLFMFDLHFHLFYQVSKIILLLSIRKCDENAQMHIFEFLKLPIKTKRENIFDLNIMTKQDNYFVSKILKIYFYTFVLLSFNKRKNI